ncbi:Pls/PosA family non-ribosomal peptide synthetase [Pseudogulbenkiania sp. MAI-1]|uniref:Pls/PosA family non-ribosomal peptide synthetase n=1 Tax=Pseudogulbenkiania sp. MAI-1 TaxID=990370 RepID=UPI0004B51AEA|nr:Pls/PosA family non-ribosomal peptide synthetase [Pseudogulbenkiania sp. MAI-1]
MMLKQLLRTTPPPRAVTPSETRPDGVDTTGTSSITALHELFERQADHRADATALIAGDQRISYAILERRANRLARYLRAHGVGRGSRVAMLLPRSVDAYVALLAILKAGAAYVPLDPAYPAERVLYILRDSSADILLTIAALASRCGAFDGAVLRIDTERAAIAAQSPMRLPATTVGVESHDLCYIIYTSGSTGRPKGVMIEHRNAVHLVCAEGRLFSVHQRDRVYQGASLCFDLSVEEVWLAFFAGATLVCAPPEMACGGPDLAGFLCEHRVTVLSCVPTLLAMLAEDVPTLRLLILGGEACPRELVERWAGPGRRLVNTYGPTEATVIATCADLQPGQPVVIGSPLPGYRVHLLDEAMRPVPHGEVGEICIGGAGVARGYVGLAHETASRFVADPFAPAGTGAKLYRTGDLGRFDDNGELEYHGRADAQVKLRGFRVELSEIESALLQIDGITAAACAVREDEPGLQHLVGYVVPGMECQVDEAGLRCALRQQLPAYMVPSLIETLDELPRQPSGKLDRSALPPPQPRAQPLAAATGRPQSGTERYLAVVWESLFRPQPVGVDDDFFLDLGGHSLLAARAVSALRKEPRFAHVSVADIYHHPTIASLAAMLDESATETLTLGETAPPPGSDAGAGMRHFLAGVLQSGGLYFHFAFGALQWATPYLVYFFLQEDGYSLAESIAWAAVAVVAMFPALLVIAIAAKWLLLGRIRPGRHRLWGGYYLRWWFAHGLIGAVPLNHLAGSPLLPLVYRLLGVRIGRDVYLGSDELAAFDLISIGDGTSIDDHASLLGYTVEDDELVIGPVNVGRRCFVGSRAVLREHTVMEDGSRLTDLSLLPLGGRIPAGETWTGSPAHRDEHPPAVPGRVPACRRRQRAAMLALYGLLVLILPFVMFAAIVPGMAILTTIDLFEQPFRYLAATPLVGASFVLLLTTEVVILKWLLLGRVRPASYPLYSGFYLRHWIIDQLMAMSLGLIGPLHATLYVAPWYRALGAKIGRLVELSTASSTMPDLLQLDDGSTVADEVSLGPPHIEGGWISLGRTHLGQRVFIGNSAVVPGGVALGDNSLVGVLSISPPTPELAAQTGASWLGSPPLRLPRREPSAGFTEQRTYNPPTWLRWARGSFEILRVTLPPAGFILVTASVVISMMQLRDSVGLAVALLWLPLVYMACCAVVVSMVVLAKWCIMGRFRPFVHPLWSLFVWRLELVNALYEFLATPLMLAALRGTPLLPWYLRLLGVHIGRRVYLSTTGFLEFDLVNLGDRVVLNDSCVMQTHLFEDRMLKASTLHVGADAEVGAYSVVLYDSVMEEGARLDALSLLMKGETLPAGTAWTGIPAAWRGSRLDQRKEVEHACRATV